MRTPVVERLAAAGAIAIGTSTRPDPAAACQAWGWNGRDHTANPWRTDRSSGGSSAGAAAAVAAGVVPIARRGADGAVSGPIPAAFCGVVGFKGSYGRVPRPAGEIAHPADRHRRHRRPPQSTSCSRPAWPAGCTPPIRPRCRTGRCPQARVAGLRVGLLPRPRLCSSGSRRGRHRARAGDSPDRRLAPPT